MANFKKDNELGKIGENLVILYLEYHGYKPKDISDDYEFHTDLLLTRENGTTFYAEVKYDTRICKTGNMFLEHDINYSDGRREKGWIHKTHADYLFYVEADTYRCHVFNYKKLYSILEGKDFKLPTKTCNDGYKHMTGICIQPADIRLKSAYMGIIRDIRVYY